MNPNLEKLVRRAWPTGLSADEESLLRKLSSEDERLVEVRLAALIEVEEGARRATRAPDDDPKGLTSSGFQSLVRRWRAHRRVETLLPYAGRAPRQRSDTQDHHAVSALIDEMLRKEPDASIDALARAAHRQSGVALAFNTVRAIARERRDAFRQDPSSLRRSYGRHLLADVCPLGAQIAVGSAFDRAVIALLIEAASGLVLGHAVGAAEASFELQRRSMSAGLASLNLDSLDVRREELASLTIVTPQDTPPSYTAALRAVLPVGQIVNSPQRRVGDRAANMLNGSVDILPLRPRGGRAARRTEDILWDAARISQVADEAVRSHNAVCLKHLRAAMSDRGFVSIGSMYGALKPVVDVGAAPALRNQGPIPHR